MEPGAKRDFATMSDSKEQVTCFRLKPPSVKYSIAYMVDVALSTAYVMNLIRLRRKGENS